MGAVRHVRCAGPFPCPPLPRPGFRPGPTGAAGPRPSPGLPGPGQAPPGTPRSAVAGGSGPRGRRAAYGAVRAAACRGGPGGRAEGARSPWSRSPRRSHRDLHPLVRQGLELGGGAVVVARRLVRHQAGDEVRRHRLEHGVGAELGVVGQDHHLGGRLHQRPVHARGEHVGRGETALRGEPAPGEERARDPQPLEGLLGAAAHQGVVGTAQRAAGHHHLHPVGMGQRLGDQEGVGDDGQTGDPREPHGPAPAWSYRRRRRWPRPRPRDRRPGRRWPPSRRWRDGISAECRTPA